MDKIPVSVLVCTKNEASNIERCLKALSGFAEVIVIDSNSTDNTCEIAQKQGAKIVPFTWNGQYPKKRQWVMDNLNIGYNWIFWVDADEVVTSDLTKEIRAAMQEGGCAGYFVQGRYIWNGKLLRHGMRNNKLALFDRRVFKFPEIHDLGIEGMDEMEGHYQPVPVEGGNKLADIGQLKVPLLHYASEDRDAWDSRHERYAHWEAEMTRQRLWPVDPVPLREILKKRIRSSYFRPYVMFIYSYVLKLGFMDGGAGLDFALSRFHYSRKILRKIKFVEA